VSSFALFPAFFLYWLFSWYIFFLAHRSFRV
jgi:hypothetical protein